MRKILILLAALALSACVDTSTSYNIDGANHALTIQAEQERFWSPDISLTLIASRWPDCQRRHFLARVPKADLAVELFATSPGIWSLRSGEQVWQVETQTCAELDQKPPAELGVLLGTYRLEKDKLIFEPAPADAGTEAPTPANPGTEAAAPAPADAPAPAPAAN